jgi:hypothetical protein
MKTARESARAGIGISVPQFPVIVTGSILTPQRARRFAGLSSFPELNKQQSIMVWESRESQRTEKQS